MLTRLPAAAAAAATLLLAAPAAAQVLIPLTRAGSGARAAGMANAFVAVSDDGTAASWNPAGLAQLRRPELSLVYSLSQRGLHFTGQRSPDDRFGFTNRHFAYAHSALDFASLALPFEVAARPATLQLGWQRLYQLHGTLVGDTSRVPLDDPEAPPVRVSIDDTVRGHIDVVSVAGALKLTSRLAVGGSVNTWRGRWRERSRVVETGGAGPGFSSVDTRNVVRGHNFTAGLLLTGPSWNAGVVYHTPFWSSYSLLGESTSSVAPATTIDSGGSARFRFPRNMGAGVAWRPAVLWTVAADVTHDRWTETVVDRLRDRAGAISFFDGVPPELSLTRDTLSVSLGVEHLFPRERSVVPVRVGFAWEPQGPMDAVTRDPVDYFMLAAGSGYNTNHLKLDMAVQYRWSAFLASEVLSVGTAVAGAPLGRDALGRVGTHEWRFKVSAIYRIPRAAARP